MKKCFSVLGTLFLVACQNQVTAPTPATQTTPQVSEEKVVVMLDWTPNTNHTGLFVAQEKGYFKDEGVSVEIQNLPDNASAADIVINNQAQFGIYFQDYMAKKLVKEAPITAVAAIVEHNTSGILVREGIENLRDLKGKTYGTWADPLELAMLETIATKDVYQDLKQVNNDAADSVVGLSNNLFDAAWIYYGWDGVLAQHENVKHKFFYAKDENTAFDFYSPIIIANNDYLKTNKEQARKVMKAIKKGYQFAIENPEEAANILMTHAPELAFKKEFVIASQKYLSAQYAKDANKWGEFDLDRWNAFYNWVNAQNIFEGKLLPQNAGVTNELLQ